MVVSVAVFCFCFVLFTFIFVVQMFVVHATSLLWGVAVFPHKKSLCHDEFIIWFCACSPVWSRVVNGNIWVIFDAYIIDLVYSQYILTFSDFDERFPRWYMILFVFEKSIYKFPWLWFFSFIIYSNLFFVEVTF